MDHIAGCYDAQAVYNLWLVIVMFIYVSLPGGYNPKT